jgi:hypothetical protein
VSEPQADSEQAIRAAFDVQDYQAGVYEKDSSA